MECRGSHKFGSDFNEISDHNFSKANSNMASKAHNFGSNKASLKTHNFAVDSYIFSINTPQKT